MDEIESPIQIAINTRRLLMDGYRGILELECLNLATDEAFEAEVRVTSEAFAAPKSRRLKLKPEGRLTRKIPWDLTGPERCAGDVAFDMQLKIENEDGHHLFRGEFSLTVLDHARTMQEVTVNIGKVIEQHDKAGMGAINEIDMSNLVNLPRQQSVNDFLTERREPRFVTIEFEYEGVVPDETDPVAHRSAPPLTGCEIVPEGGERRRTLVLTGDGVTIGRSRAQADLVAWALPRTEENDAKTRSISARHCRIGIDADGVFVENLSRVNSTRVDGRPIRGKVVLRSGQSCTLQLASAMEFRVRTLPPSVTAELHQALLGWISEPGCRERWNWSDRHGAGGVLIERTDGWPECYIWVASSVAAPLATSIGDPVQLASVPSLSINRTDRTAAVLAAGLGAVSTPLVPLARGDVLELSGRRFTIQDARQAFDGDTDDPAS